MSSDLHPIWLLIDGNNHVHQDFHASGGVAGRAVSNMAKRLEAMRAQFRIDRLVVALDSPTSFRSELEPEYKANRPEKPDALRAALAGIRTVCMAEEIDLVEAPGFEADDCIATLTRIGLEAGRRVIISSADKDLRQLLRAEVVTQLLSVARQGDRLKCQWMTAHDLFKRYALRPHQWVDYQTLVGDPTDNVIGADGIGEKTAAKILQHCGSLECYYENVWAVGITSKQRESLKRFRRRMDVVRQLVTLRSDVPLPVGWMEAVT